MTTDTATLVSRLKEMHPAGPPSDEHVLAQEISFRPAQWAKRWPGGLDRPAIVDRPDPSEVARADLFTEAGRAHSEADAVALFVAICAWGTGKKARSVSRCAKALNDPKLGQKLLRARDLATADPSAAYTSMMKGGENKVVGLGPAFFTKWLHFATYQRCDVVHPPLILDALVASTLGWHSTGWSGSTYATYLDIAQQVRDQWCPGQSTYTVEYSLFRLGKVKSRPNQTS